MKKLLISIFSIFLRYKFAFLFILIRNSILYGLSCLFIELDFLNLFLVKIQSMILGKGLHFLFYRLGWAGGILFTIILSLLDSISMGNMMVPSGASGASSSRIHYPQTPPSVPAEKPSSTEIFKAPSPFERPLQILEIPNSPEEELDLSNQKDPRVIEYILLNRSKDEMKKKKEQLAESISPLIEETAQKFPSIRQVPTPMEFVSKIIKNLATNKAQKGDDPSATHKDLTNLKSFLTRAYNSAIGKGGRMDVPQEMKKIRKSLAPPDDEILFFIFEIL